jgi:hypothetical protein
MELLGKQAILEEAIMYLERDIIEAESRVQNDKNTVKQLRLPYKVL